MTKARGQLFEKLVSNMWNNWDLKYKTLSADQRKEMLNEMERGSWHAVHELKQNITTTELAEKISTAEVNENWAGNKYGEPKTDVKIGNYKISLKYGPAQIMSSSPEEIKSVLDVATSHINNKPILNKIKNTLNKLIEYQKNGGIIAKKLTIKDKYIDILTGEEKVKGISDIFDSDSLYLKIKEIKKIHKQLQNYFIKLFNDKTIKHKFIEEALTGKMKYDGNDGSATHILGFSKKDNKHIFKSFNYDTIKEISNMSNISMSFKSSGSIKTKEDPKGKRLAWSVLRIIMDELSNNKH